MTAHSGQDRRTEARALTAALINITDETTETSTCVLEDLSSSGARVHSEDSFRVGSKVTLKVGSVVHEAEIKHCRSALDGYDIGLEFVGGAWPTPIQFPIHWIPVERA